MHIDHDRAEGGGSFGAWLRYERERRKISIASIAESTKILGALFEGLENDDLTRWPDGFYRRGFVRAYGRAIGLDPDWVLREFLLRFPAPEANHTAPGPQDPSQTAMPRLMLADSREWFDAVTFISRIRRQLTATAIDGAVISVLAASLWIAYDLLWEPLAIVACGYFSISTLIFGSTPGLRAVSQRGPQKDRRSYWHAARGLIARLVSHPHRVGLFERPGSAEQELLGG
jgi:helix-turn-helix protein